MYNCAYLHSNKYKHNNIMYTSDDEYYELLPSPHRTPTKELTDYRYLHIYIYIETYLHNYTYIQYIQNMRTCIHYEPL